MAQASPKAYVGTRNTSSLQFEPGYAKPVPLAVKLFDYNSWIAESITCTSPANFHESTVLGHGQKSLLMLLNEFSMLTVAELTKVEREELEKKEKQLRGLEASAKPKAKKTSVTGVVPLADYKKAQLAMQVRLKEA
ncbi:unnamed protein product, partial [Durusdinium trenchii]